MEFLFTLQLTVPGGDRLAGEQARRGPHAEQASWLDGENRTYYPAVGYGGLIMNPFRCWGT
jgi:hypothetical protein